MSDPERDLAGLTRLSVVDSLRLLGFVVIPTWSKGILFRRRLMMSVAEHLRFDARAVRTMQNLRRKYGEGPLLIRGPRRPQVLIMSGDDVRRILAGAPEPFTPATREKKEALAHFEPHVSLTTRGPDRVPRRALSDAILESDTPIHHLARRFRTVVAEETAALNESLAAKEDLTWPRFADAWFCSIRRIVLGDAARDDHEVTDMLASLGGRSNWVFLRAKETRLRWRFHARLTDHLARGESGSLAEFVARQAHADDSPSNQVSQWLFASTAGGITTWRALALLATHPQSRNEALAETDGDDPLDMPFLRACFMEAVRLWPTTPAILRETTRATRSDGIRLPAGSGLIIYAPFFHRDNERLDYADRFEPRFWMGRDPAEALPFVPFSAGPASCPGRYLIALVGSFWLSSLLRTRHLKLIGTKLGPDRPLPATLDHFSLRFRSED